MANQTGQSSGIPQLNRNLPVSTDIPQVQYATQAPGNVGAFSSDAHALANSLDQINSLVNDRMDRQASEQGEQQGTVAGGAGDVPLKDDGTIRGQAFDAAAARTMLATHDVAARQAADRIYLANRDNPAALQTQLNAYSSGVLSSNMPDVVKAQFKNDFGNISNAYTADAGLRVVNQQMDSDKAAYLQSLDQRQKTVENLAKAPLTPQSTAALANEVDSLKKFAVSYGPKGAFTLGGVDYPADNTRAGITSAADIQQLVQQTSDHAKEMSALGGFMQQPTLQAQQSYMLKFQQAFADGQGGFDLEHYDRTMKQMHVMLDQKEALTRGQVEAVKGSFETVNKQMENGFSPGADAVNAIQTQATATGDPVAMALGRQAQGLFQFQQAARQMPPAQLQDWINSTRSTLNASAAQGHAPDPLAVAQVEMGQKLLTNMSTELQRDPLSWGARVGLVNVAPLDGTPAAAASRLASAHTVAAHYNTPLQVLTSEEAQQFKNVWDQGNPDQRTALVQQVQSNFGNDAVSAFNDLAKTSPGIANVGALLASNPDAHIQTVRDYATGDMLLAGKDKTLPESGQLASHQSTVLGDVYGFAPLAQQAVLDTASRLYAARAARQGLAPEDFKNSQPAQTIYDKGLQESAGAWWDRAGKQYGGIIEQKYGHNIVLPPNMTEDDFNNTLKSMTDADLQHVSVGGAVPKYSTGRVMSANDLRDKYLISVGAGKYILADKNPKIVDPNAPNANSYIHGSGMNGVYEMDLTGFKGGGK